jgi:hypothetical protein
MAAAKKTRRPAKAKKAAGAKGARPARMAKAEGGAPVRRFIAQLDGWKKEVAQRFDALVDREVPHVRRAVKWSTPMYGVEGQGWFAAFGVFTKHVKINFFMGSKLKPTPPAGSSKYMRSVDMSGPDEFDEQQIRSWVRQAAAIPGWGK